MSDNIFNEGAFAKQTSERLALLETTTTRLTMQVEYLGKCIQAMRNGEYFDFNDNMLPAYEQWQHCDTCHE